MSRSWTVPGVVVKVHDGDTATLDLDLGWFLTNRQPVRFAHINAPELNTPEGKVSAAMLKTLLFPGVRVELVSAGLDKYGRSLGVITRLDKDGLPEDKSINQVMLDTGMAVPYEGGKR